MKFPLSFIAFVAVISMGTSQAFAWGICGRGPWVYPDDWNGADSVCSCSNGLAGILRAWRRDDVMMQWFAGPLNGGVGGEYEVTYDNGSRDFLPMVHEPLDHELLHSGWYHGSYMYAYPHPHHLEDTPPDTPHLTGRVRSVCITNYPSVFDAAPDPWGFRWQ